MRLSEAIRLGAMLRPQGIGTLNSSGSCALGAAGEAIGAKCPQAMCGILPLLVARWPRLMSQMVTLPCACRFDFPFGSAVLHLNDNHRWTREQIADWVETIEPQADESQTAVEVAQPVVAVARTQNFL